jgi:hypothetical protein
MPPELKAVASRLSQAAACHLASVLFAGAAGLQIQRLADRLAAGLETPETALEAALAAEAAALSVRHVPPMETRDVTSGNHPSFH